MPLGSPRIRLNLEDAFALLLHELRGAKLQFEKVDAGGRDGVISALTAVVEFLFRFEEVRDEGLHGPLARLVDDLITLSGGKSSPMLRPKRKSGGATTTKLYQSLKGLSVVTVERLESTGMAPLAARKSVANLLTKYRVRMARKGTLDGSRYPTERTLRKWQRDIRSDRGNMTISAKMHRVAKADDRGDSLPAGSSADVVAGRRREYLDILGNFIRTTRAAEST